MSKLQEELKQGQPFRNLPEEAILNVWRTADFAGQRFQQLLKDYGISQTQYNVLRILRGANQEGLPCGEIAERMLTRDPDITRLMDRLVHSGFARRVRLRQDRRVILAKITPVGVHLLDELKRPVAELIDEMMGRMKPSQLETLIELLEQVRNGRG